MFPSNGLISRGAVEAPEWAMVELEWAPVVQRVNQPALLCKRDTLYTRYLKILQNSNNEKRLCSLLKNESRCKNPSLSYLCAYKYHVNLIVEKYIY